MKKILSLLATVSLITTISTSTISCNQQIKEKNINLGVYEIDSENFGDQDKFEQWIEMQRKIIGQNFDSQIYTSFVVSKDSKWISFEKNKSAFVNLESLLSNKDLNGI